jgi:hypothetical protein
VSRKFTEFISEFITETKRDLAADLKPFFSILFIISTLFAIVFLQMEERRHGYAILKLTRAHKLIVEEKRVKSIQMTKLTRPQQIERMAQTRLTMKRVRAEQIIHLTSSSELISTKGEN